MNIQKYVADVFREYGWLYTPGKVNLTEMWAIINKKGNFQRIYRCSLLNKRTLGFQISVQAVKFGKNNKHTDWKIW